MIKFISSLSRLQKSFIILLSDSIAIIASYFIALTLRLNDPWPIEWIYNSWALLVFSVMIGIVFSWILGLPLIKLSAFEGKAQMRVAYWVLLVSSFSVVANILFSLGAPRTVPLIQGFLLFVLSVGLRYLVLSALNDMALRKYKGTRVRVAVYGAGTAGMQLVSSLKRSPEFDLVAIIDDSKNLQGVMMAGVNVISPKSIEKEIKIRKIEKIFLAIPSLNQQRKKTILSDLINMGCEVKELPSYAELIESGDILKSLKPVTPDSLLGRSDVEIELPRINNAYADKNVLVSGAGGSIGSELARIIMSIGPKRLILFDMSELALYQIEKELRPIAISAGIKLFAVLGSVADHGRINKVLQLHSVDVVAHAAAYKHVPLIEENEIEAGRNNIIGTKTIAEAAAKNKVGRFILVSTDKAVRPTNVMGASKRFAEHIIQNLDKTTKGTIFTIVRFGNVLGSSGSVIPLFKEQIEKGGPITLTHKDVTRYFMTIPEAARLVLLAGSLAEGGDVFVLDMGKPIKIIDLAKQMIELSGLQVLDEANPDGDIAIDITGLRPGEKLYEELLIGENTLSTPHEKIMRAQEKSMTTAKIEIAISKIHSHISKNNGDGIRKVLLETVEGYKPS